MISRPRRVHVLVALLLSGACGGGTAFVDPPPPPQGDLTLRILPDPADESTGTALGWATGIPGAEVRLMPRGATDSGAPLSTGADGSVLLAGASQGDYLLLVRRWLSPTEQALLGPGDDALGFVLHQDLRVAGRAAVDTVRAPASRRGTLVFAEYAQESTYDPIIGGYVDGGYVVIANNTDSTIYLDGMLLGVADALTFEAPGFPCSLFDNFQNDPTGVWGGRIERFPGTGRDFPIQPGEHKLIATDAIDHRPLIQQGYDLSNADFESLGSRDVDNPSVPNLTSVGPRQDLGGHGLSGFRLINPWYLAVPTDLATLRTANLPVSGSKVLHIPAERLLQVVSLLTVYDYPQRLCPVYVHRRFDQKTAYLLGDGMYLFSAQRLRTGASGNGPYQWTRNSAADLFRAPKTAPR